MYSTAIYIYTKCKQIQLTNTSFKNINLIKCALKKKHIPTTLIEEENKALCRILAEKYLLTPRIQLYHNSWWILDPDIDIILIIKTGDQKHNSRKGETNTLLLQLVWNSDCRYKNLHL